MIGLFVIMRKASLKYTFRSALLSFVNARSKETLIFSALDSIISVSGEESLTFRRRKCFSNLRKSRIRVQDTKEDVQHASPSLI
jgi:hypothetical protein